MHLAPFIPAALLVAFPFAHAGVINARQAPAPVQNFTTIKSPSGATIRYKEPGKHGVCETTPGVNSYNPLTLWLNGGPGSDSLIGAFEEIGPCYVDEHLKTQKRAVSWSNSSNLLFLSQPVGTGFSYSSTKVGYLDPTYLDVSPAEAGEATGRYSIIDPTKLDTSKLAAVACWELLQGFYGALSQFDKQVASTDFSLWAESFGGHWGPAFASYFYEQNQKLTSTSPGRKLNFKSFGIGLKLINDTIYDHGKFNMYRDGGCQQAQDYCAYLTKDSIVKSSGCAAAQYICQNDVEDLYYTFGGNRGVYDIRACNGKDVPPAQWRDYLNQASVQQAIGTDLNYTSSNLIYTAFSLSGDFAVGYIDDLQELLGYDIQISLVYGDADYICNWQGGEDISTSAKAAFKDAGYTKLVVNGKEYGETRQYGKFSFTRVWESGHEVPYFQPEAAFAIFNRSQHGLDVATGKVSILENPSYSTKGTPNTVHSRQLPPLSCPASS
ncbi:hypothetical protein M409DRAFT_69273 [Zasmidium cellare ATCC 36951]|uniref:Carboxypeptidase n=1 Tax=Zasmidium cellare ATCC 36951 TaxID=1080233 RepID=A0A6A6C4E3_ZASCE|nr:uncharacterized protein M409DRAFT_69273 [Zasmidium cellare ATCC 36951]KAF2162027.1 hypothetical protein M409DRAFT_69273 [Zasmidium cellare ATCC 36951]